MQGALIVIDHSQSRIVDQRQQSPGGAIVSMSGGVQHDDKVVHYR